VCSALGQIAKHSVDLAEVVVEAEVFPKCLTCLRYPDEFVQKHAATLVSRSARSKRQQQQRFNEHVTSMVRAADAVDAVRMLL
jgi:hypothetical protein